MSIFSFFFRQRHAHSEGNFRHVQGEIFDPGAEVYSAETTVGDPQYTLTVFPQWNFTPLQVYQTPMVLQTLSLPDAPPQGFPYGGMRSTNLISPDDYPDVEGNYWS